MFSRILTSGSSAALRYNAQRITAYFVNGAPSRGISTYASQRFDQEWTNPEKQDIAKTITLATIVSTTHTLRELAETQPPLAPGKIVHSSVVYAHGSTYGQPCAVDKIFAVCPEHLLLMRTAIGILRNPNPNIEQISYIIAAELGKELSKLDPKTLGSLFELGSNVKESRSKDMIEDQSELIRILTGEKKVSPQQLSRVLEFVLSPLGMIANTFGGPRCKVANAKKEQRDIGDLEQFMENVMMPSLSRYHVPYIKAPGSPYSHLQMQQYAQGAPITEEERVTINHYLECCSRKGSPLPEIPQLRSVIVKDPKGRTIHLHDHMNLPHFFDVSGTTGAVMQASLGLLDKAGKLELVDGPNGTINLGMTLVGCNFYKQGYHNYYEVLPALHWVNHNVWKQPFVEMTPTELLQAVPESLKECVDPQSPMAPKVGDTLDLVTEHFALHYELYKENLLTSEKDKEQSLSSPGLGGSDKD
ncbi:hypothetical protein Lsan_3913 [Legionella santicrucis]|uniref:Uncharacterized protein n=1 Tax=Legionella santicrucis TaxID=45074 RepID=A0A0W0Y9Y2_9GAMM|nr:hypothetical protein [Legionella santicrucis]KTD53503.1 hypothetical protein Lsan_3913 [Legionella santicrucis]